MSRAPVILENYNPLWPEQFEAEKAQLFSIAGKWQVGAIEHIGSTAVPGIPAKPVIDIMFGVQTLEESKPAIDALSANGYQYWPYKVDLMHWFCKPDDSFRTHHLHLVPFESELWQQRICFRDKLRNSAALAKEYAELKQALAAKYRNDREAYTDKKWPFFQKVLK